MIDNSEIIRSVLKNESKALSKLLSMDFSSINAAIGGLSETTGKIVVSGIGKSAIVAQKFVATLNSTGCTATFLHASDALHGDIGVINDNDALILISKSGASKELVDLVQLIEYEDVFKILISCNESAPVAHFTDVHIVTPMDKEADPNGLAPTTSIILHLAVCDTIAVALQEKNGFSSDHFAKLHPHGSLGKRLLLKAIDVGTRKDLPKVMLDANVKTIIYEISSKRIGACCVCDEKDRVLGIITDGDIRRMLERGSDIQSISASDIMTKNPKNIDVSTMAYDALRIMKESNISHLIIQNDNDDYLGIVHLHDLLHEGL